MRSLSLVGAGRAVRFAVLLLAVPSGAAAGDTDASAPLTPDAAVTAALSLHPAVRAAEADLLHNQGLRAEAGLLVGNPTASASRSLAGERSSLALSQPLSVTGEGLRARAAADARVDAATAALSRARLSAASDARLAYVDAVVATGGLRVAGEGLELAGRLRMAVTRQLEEGEASTLDQRLAQLAEVQAASNLLAARQAQAEALRALAGLVGRPIDAGALLVDPLAAAPSPTPDLGAERSDLRAARDRVRAAERELQAQRAAALPPVALGVFADREGGETYLGPSIGVELPLFRRNQAGRGDAQGQVQLAEGALLALTARAETERSTAGQRSGEAEQVVGALVADPAGVAHAALQSVEAGYLAGEIDLATTVLLQGAVRDGEAAALVLRGLLAAARLDLLLATDDPQLLGGAR